MVSGDFMSNVETAEKLQLSLREGSSGLSIYARLDPSMSSYDCVEFTVDGTKEIAVFTSPWMQFEPVKLKEERSKVGSEIVRRAIVHDSLVKQIEQLSSICVTHLDRIHSLYDDFAVMEIRIALISRDSGSPDLVNKWLTASVEELHKEQQRAIKSVGSISSNRG
jgi:hypothetical protein